jgi:hypothetical protein
MFGGELRLSLKINHGSTISRQILTIRFIYDRGILAGSVPERSGAVYFSNLLFINMINMTIRFSPMRGRTRPPQDETYVPY